MEKKEISIVIPAYNEEKRIGNSLKKILSYLKKNKFNFEIIVVDDGSTDNTIKIVKKINSNIRIIKNNSNKGKGFSVRKGILSANKQLILFSDADLSTPIEELPRLIKAIEDDYDLAIGSRAITGAKIEIHQPFYREAIGRIFNKIVQTIATWGIKDTQCGFKLFKKKTAKEIFSRLTINNFGFDVEAIFIAKKKGYKIKEIPITWINSAGSKVSPVKDSIKMFLDLFKIRIYSLLGKYK
ncbi:dolichyl-phosphate beta-glucosyltransferase [Nanoarchaeota archaeon]